MTSVIGELRGFDGYEGLVRDEKAMEIDELLQPNKDFKSEVVHKEHEEGGRWSNYETKVYAVSEGEEKAYFRVVREVPATESQDGMDLSFEFSEVHPREVTTTIYE